MSGLHPVAFWCPAAMLPSESCWSECPVLPLGTRISPRLSCCCPRTCLCPWSSCSWGLRWTLWHSLTLGTIQRPCIWDIPCDFCRVRVRRPCQSRCHTAMGNLYHLTDQGVILLQSATEGHILVHVFVVAEVQIDICGISCHQVAWRNLGSNKQPESMLEAEVQDASISEWDWEVNRIELHDVKTPKIRFLS